MRVDAQDVPQQHLRIEPRCVDAPRRPAAARRPRAVLQRSPSMSPAAARQTRTTTSRSPERRSTSTPVEPSVRRTSRSTTASPTTRFSRRTSGSQRRQRRRDQAQLVAGGVRRQAEHGAQQLEDAARGPRLRRACDRVGDRVGRGGPVEAAEQLRQPGVPEELGRLQQGAGDPGRLLAVPVAPEARGADGVVVRPDAADVVADGVVAGHAASTGSGCPSR